MNLDPQDSARFFGIMFPVLYFVNKRLSITSDLPAVWEPDAPTPGVPTVQKIRNKLWKQPGLLSEFIEANPASVSAWALETVRSWHEHHLRGDFYIMKHLKKYAVFLSATSPARAYGVLGLSDPIKDIIGADPVLVKAVLLPFDRRIVYDGLVEPEAWIGSGMLGSLAHALRDAQEREGVITSLSPEERSPEQLRTDIRSRNRLVLSAFRRDLARGSIRLETVEAHIRATGDLADTLLRQQPPLGLLDLTSDTLRLHFSVAGKTANRVSFRRFVRFLEATWRIAPAVADELLAAVK